jgi:hypothetical protein
MSQVIIENCQFSQTHSIIVSEPSSYASIVHLEAWLQIIQSFSLLLCFRSLPQVFSKFSFREVVEKALRMFPQFRNVASFDCHNKETS